VTQRYVVELARELGLTSVCEPIALGQVPLLEEAFLTGSTRGIVPVVAVESMRVGSGRPGPWTLRLRAAYEALVRRAARPAWVETASSIQ
jgi:branched-subunit amino acid aminotransferase/4-amino-4-deoxychorismate lyase